ncbi:unnamed protein product [Ceutorhynchus assimilis]|uniref:Uncharacterized protein n=1 Tax=Ceutorhynchus assimilis TaxID=467358 RepID=A0A9N9QG10_9CUCU|nr:unnamed protein product [Ceutorhynchus assimilis]
MPSDIILRKNRKKQPLNEKLQKFLDIKIQMAKADFLRCLDREITTIEDFENQQEQLEAILNLYLGPSKLKEEIDRGFRDSEPEKEETINELERKEFSVLVQDNLT